MLMTVLKVAGYSVDTGKDKAVTSFTGKHTEFQYFSITEYAWLLPKTSVVIFHISLSGECQPTQNICHSLLSFSTPSLTSSQWLGVGNSQCSDVTQICSATQILEQQSLIRFCNT